MLKKLYGLNDYPEPDAGVLVKWASGSLNSNYLFIFVV